MAFTKVDNLWHIYPGIISGPDRLKFYFLKDPNLTLENIVNFLWQERLSYLTNRVKGYPISMGKKSPSG